MSKNGECVEGLLDNVAPQLLFAGLLVGGESSRMGSPKPLVRFGGSTLGEIAVRALRGAIGAPNVVLLGAGSVPESMQALTRLLDPPGLKGPAAGLLAAHRWAPNAAWVLAACDHPWLTSADIQWLVEKRRPGAWAIVPRQPDGHPCPTLALYEPQALAVLEQSIVERGAASVRIAELLDHPRTLIVPTATRGLINVNTPDELSAQEALAKANRSAIG